MNSIRKRYSQWSKYRRTLRELRSLDDRELNDLGLGRGDIETVARRAVR